METCCTVCFDEIAPTKANPPICRECAYEEFRVAEARRDFVPHALPMHLRYEEDML